MVISRFLSYIMILIAGATLSACNGSVSNSESAANNSEGLQYNKDDVAIMKAMGSDVSEHRVECQEHRHSKNKQKDKICVAVCHRPPGNPNHSKSMILPLSAVVAHLNHGSKGHEIQDTLGYCKDIDHEDEDEDEDSDENDDSNNDGTLEENNEVASNHGHDKKPGKNCGKHNEDNSDADDTINNNNDSSDEDNGSINEDYNNSDDDETPISNDSTGDDSTEAPTCNDLPCDDSGEIIEDMGDIEDAPVIPPFCEVNYDIDNNCDGLHDLTGEELY